VYFRYPERTADAWAELKRLGLLIRRIGGVQAQLHPAHRDIALLTSLTTNSFDRYHALFQTYAYHNLMQAHLSVEMVAEDEVLAITRARSYPVILLHGIKYLRQSTFRALTAFAAAGGTVLADTTVPFELPGAKRVALNLATGAEPGPSAAAAADLADYGRADHVLRVARVMEPHMAPRFRSADSTLVASEFEAAGMPYTWFVNTYDGDEYMLCRRFRSGPPPPDLAALRDWEQQHVVQRTFTTQVTYATLPGIPYDLGRGKELDVVKSEDGAFTITLTMDRLGGALIAWLPGKLTGIALSVPERAQTGEHVRFCAQLQATAQMHGPLPVHFELIDPHGHVALDSGMRVTAKDGAAELVWTPAVNDALGTWTVTATELASGRSTKRTVVLAAAAD
jgi:hypothetical protein